MQINKMNIVEALVPQTGGTNTGDYVSLKNVIKAHVIVQIDQGDADTAVITIEQAQAVANTGHTAITKAVPIWVNLDCAASDVLVAATAAVSYETDAGVKHKIVEFEIDPATFDIANGFDCMMVKVVVGAASKVSALYLLEQRYSGAVEITD